MRIALVAICLPALAWAEEPPPVPAPAEAPPQPEPVAAPAEPVATPPEPVAAPAEPVEPPPTPAELAEEIDELRAEQDDLARAQRTDAATRDQVKKKLLPLTRFINVFVDVGAFAVAGDGSGIRSDVGHVYFPAYENRIPGQWVFMGDPLSVGVNALGEPADTANSREITNDTLNSEGRPSLVVNAIGLTIRKDITDTHVSVAALAQLLPRPDHNILDLQYAQITYRPLSETNLELEAGKINSVLGIEYREQDAPERLTVTPSLICRYICGRPLGAGARLTLGRLFASATLTNGDNFQTLFEPKTALSSNGLPTASAHVQWTLPVGRGLQVGVSGAIGPQDNQPDRGVRQWHFGFDARVVDLAGFDIAAEYVQGKQEGRTESMVRCDAAPCLRYKGAYVLVDRRMTSWLTPYVRADWRSAVHTKGTEFVYESHTWRTTIGARFEMTSRVLAKLEYTWNRELGGIPQFPDDVITSSIVVATD